MSWLTSMSVAATSANGLNPGGIRVMVYYCYTPTSNLQYTPQAKETPLAGSNARSAYSRSRPAIASEDRRLPSSQRGKTFLSARPLAVVADAVASRVRCGNLRVVTELQLGLAPPLRRKED